eukprot:24564-Pelagomonas_calceolata.AAC.3
MKATQTTCIDCINISTRGSSDESHRPRALTALILHNMQQEKVRSAAQSTKKGWGKHRLGEAQAGAHTKAHAKAWDEKEHKMNHRIGGSTC